ncbi:hypothetical protein FRB90_010489 [Tulasnella sp. 427]|nr:hypothetical protein FRB90_010489 [Tulasnella sp. 427]
MAPPPPPPSKTKKRTAKSTYAQRLSIRIENDSDAFEQSVQESMDDFFDDKSFWETMGDSAQAKLLRMMEDWKAFIETRPVDEGHRFAPKTFYRCSYPFIESKVIDTLGKRNPDRVHWSTLEQWLTYLVKPIHNFCTETVNDRDICYGAKLLREGLEPSDTGLWLLFARTGQRLFKKYALARWRQKKTYWTRYELAMLVDATLNTSASMEVALQQVLLLTLSFLTSARVGAFGYSYDNWKEQGKYLQLGDVAVFRDLVVPGQFQMTVTIKNLKGYNGSKGSVPLVIHLGALQNPWKLFMEPAPVFLALLLHRKQLRDHTTLESLLTGREHQIRYVDNEEPL